MVGLFLALDKGIQVKNISDSSVKKWCLKKMVSTIFTA